MTGRLRFRALGGVRLIETVRRLCPNAHAARPAKSASDKERRWLSADDASGWPEPGARGGVPRAKWWFGRLSGHTDMHFGNVALFLSRPRSFSPGFRELALRNLEVVERCRAEAGA
jgi:hypothetical protein